MLVRRSVVPLVLLLAAAPPPAALAQQADTVRGTVRGPDGEALAHARVTVAPMGATTGRLVRTEDDGTFAVVFRTVPVPGRVVRYEVDAAYIGHSPGHRTVARPAPGEPLPRADFELAHIPQRLERFQVTLQRRPPPRPPRPDGSGDLDPDVGAGATQHTVDLATVVSGDPSGALPPALATVPGATPVPELDGAPAGITVLGLPPEQTAVTVNGMAFAGAALPRDGVRAQVTTASADPGRGGFLGAQVRVALPVGSPTPVRTLRFTPEHPGLQWADATLPGGRGTTGGTLTGQLSGPIGDPLGDRFGDRIGRPRLVHNLSYRVDRRWSDPPTLASATLPTLHALGLPGDSVARLRAISAALGIPEHTSATPDASIATSGSLLARVDWIRDTNTTLTLETNAARATTGGTAPPTALPTYAGGNTTWSLGLTPRVATYVHGFVLTETSLALSAAETRARPYLVLPAASVLVGATGASAGGGSLLLGGNPGGTSDTRRLSTQLRSQATWFTRDGRHRFQLTLDLQRTASRFVSRSGLGTFAFNSLAELEAGRPASFARAFADADRTLADAPWFLGAGDVHKPFPGLTLQYGLQLQGTHVGVQPAYNPAVDSLLRRHTDHLPGGATWNPMLGVDWQVGTWGPPRITGSRAPTAAEAARRAAAAARRGTLSLVLARRSAPIPATAVDVATRQSGLPGGARQLRCVGAAAPTPDWQAWLDALAIVPEQCADGTAASPLASGAPPVSLFAPDFAAPVAWNASLSWRGTLLRRPGGAQLGASAAATWLLARRQQGPFDLNFAGTPRFILPAEEDRPVFVSPASISAATGSVAARESRRFDQFAQVTELRSDLASDSRQLQLGLTGGLPAWRGLTAAGATTYTFLDARSEARAFATAPTAGDPRTLAWLAAAAPRHALVLSGTLAVRRWFTLAVTANVASGRPFTPRVASDVNGDGLANDQAFVFDPATAGDSALAAGMASLLATSRDAARCLGRQLGRLAERDGCRGPRTAQIHAAISPGAGGLTLGDRVSVAFGVSNALAAVDRLLHGTAGVRGWGAPALAAPDPVLLRVRAFDPAAPGGPRFRYAVNPLFASTTAARAAVRAPFALTLDVRVDLGPDRESQQIAAALRPRPADGVRVLPERELRRRLPTASAPELQSILRLRDSLALTRPQADSLGALVRRVTAARDSVWSDLARYLASQHGRYGSAETRRRWRRATADAARAFDEVLPAIGALLTPAQRAKLPPSLRARVDAPGGDPVKPRVAGAA